MDKMSAPYTFLWKTRGLKFRLNLYVVYFIFSLIPFFSSATEQTNLSGIKISIRRENVSLKEVLNVIEKQSDFLFLRDDHVDIEKRVSINVRDKSLEETLDILFEHSDVNYKIAGKHVWLSVKKEKLDEREQIRQKKRVSGTITDSNGDPVIGANVVEIGEPTNGTITDMNGNFSIETNANAILKISYIGYVEQEVKTSAQKTLRIVLNEDTKFLEEVVVTALGIERNKKTLSYSSQQVDVMGLSKIKDVSLGNSLSGKIAGVTILSSTGSAGVTGDPRIIIRGNRSIHGNNQPLIVVDGNPYSSSGGGLSRLNPDDIASMNVLKGPTAAALYGSSAQNGAVIVTTKKGKIGKPQIEINSSSVFDQPFLYPEFQNEYSQGSNGVYSANAEGDSWGARMMGQTVKNWTGEDIPLLPQKNNVKDIFGTGYNLVNGISYSAGNEKYSAYFSYANTTAQGLINTNKMQRHNFNLKMTAELWKHVTFDFKVTWYLEDVKNSPDQGDSDFSPMMQAFIMPRSIRTKDIKAGSYVDEMGHLKQLTWTPKSTLVLNPYWAKKGRENPSKSNMVNSLAVLKYRFTDWLTLQLRSGLGRSNSSYESKVYWDTYYINTGKGDYRKGSSESQDFNADFLVTFTKKVAPTWAVNASIGGEWRDSKGSWIDTRVKEGGLSMENKFGLAYAANGVAATENDWHTQKQSIYGMGQLAFHDYLFLDVTWRNDWSSTLPSPYRYAYPSVGLTAVISEMVPLPKWFSFVKLRGIYAEVGNDAPRSMIYQTFEVQDGGPLGWVSPKSTRMPVGLIPEKTKSWEAGAEIRFLQDRLGLDFTYYKSNTYNQLMRVTTPPTSGYGSTWFNTGNIQNKGIEIILWGTPVQTIDWSWDVQINYAKNINTVVELSPTLDRYKLATPDQAMGQSWVEKGRPFGEIYVRDFQKNAAGRYLVSEKGMPLVETDPVTYLGNFNYDWTSSMTNTFKYKNWNLYFLIDWNNGGYRVSGSESYLMFYGTGKNSLHGREEGFIFDGMKENGQQNDIPITAQDFGQLVGGRSYNSVGKIFSHKATNSRLRELSVGYAIPLKGALIKGMEVSLVGRNLFFIYNGCKWFDPDVTYNTRVNGQGFESAFLPMSRSVGLNIKLKL